MSDAAPEAEHHEAVELGDDFDRPVGERDEGDGEDDGGEGDEKGDHDDASLQLFSAWTRTRRMISPSLTGASPSGSEGWQARR